MPAAAMKAEDFCRKFNFSLKIKAEKRRQMMGLMKYARLASKMCPVFTAKM